MVDWTDPTEISRDGGRFYQLERLCSSDFLAHIDVFLKLVFTLFGAYLWELFSTCEFEWSLLSRHRKFRWPLVSSPLTYAAFDRS